MDSVELCYVDREEKLDDSMERSPVNGPPNMCIDLWITFGVLRTIDWIGFVDAYEKSLLLYGLMGVLFFSNLLVVSFFSMAWYQHCKICVDFELGSKAFVRLRAFLMNYEPMLGR